MIFKRLWPAICLTAGCCAYASDSPGSSEIPSSADIKSEFSTTYHTYQQLVADNKFAEALPYAERAYQLGGQIYSAMDKSMAALALNLGDAQLRTGHVQDAAATLDSALPLYEQIYGGDAPEMVDPLMERGDIAGSVDAKQQRSYYDRAIRIARSHFAADDLTMARLNLEAGQHLLQAGNETAGDYLVAAYDQYEKQLPATDARLGGAAFWLGKYQLTIGNAALSERYLQQALTALGGEGPPPNPLVAAAHNLLVRVYARLNDRAKVTEQCQAVGKLQLFDEPSVVPLYRANPLYPGAAKSARQEGWVQMEITIDAEGSVRDPIVLAAKPEDTFNDAALAAIRQWRYAPQSVGGKPVDRPCVHITMQFELSH